LAIATSCVLLRRRGRLVSLLVLNLPANNLAIERKSLKDQVEPAAILVREGQTDVQPIVVLAFALDY
jgi:hypothetical protein